MVKNFLKYLFGRKTIVFVPGINWSSKDCFRPVSKYLSGFDFVFHDTGSWHKKNFESLKTSAEKLSKEVNDLSGEVFLVGWSYGGLVINKAMPLIEKKVKKIVFINTIIGYKSFKETKDYLDAFLKIDEFKKIVKNLRPGLKRKIYFKNVIKHVREYWSNMDELKISKQKLVFVSSYNDILIPHKLVKKQANHFGCEFYSMPGTHESLINHPKELSLILKEILK